VNSLTTRLAFVLGLLSGCTSPDAPLGDPPRSRRPFAVVLGTAQDGGLPQLGCRRPCCESARLDPGRRRRVASLAVVDPESGRRWLFDASPDLPEQVALLDALDPERPLPEGRPPPFEAVFLTHAHMGHVAGLVQLGREAYAARGQVVRASPVLVKLLRTQGLWRVSVEHGHVVPEVLLPDEPVVLARGDDGQPRLTVTALAIPHRAELSDTYAYRVDGPDKTLLYLPDIDDWGEGPLSLEGLLRDVDVALLDGSFFSRDELPDRSTHDVPHPPMAQTLARLADLPGGFAERVVFTHLNHSNPAADPGGPQARQVRDAGAAVAFDGQRIGL
jgi:pyrroloquinoline quinone biosynthesis protein B